MARVREMMKVDGREYWTLFDTEVRSTYVVHAVLEKLPTMETPHPIRTSLGGRVKLTWRTALLQAEVQGHLVSTHALVVDEIGNDEDGRPIEILFGALALQQWGIRPISEEDRLDLSHYPEESVESRLASFDTPTGAHQMKMLEIDSSAFDQVSLHDVNIYVMFLQKRQHEVNLVLDIDYLGEWTLLPDNRFDFLVVPATLTFLNVVDLQIHLDWGPSLRREEPYGVIDNFSGQVMIYDFRRFAYTDPVYAERSYRRYELRFSEPLDGQISLGARDFTIVGRQEGVRSSRSIFDPAQRVPLVILGGQVKESEPDGH